jgi:hypothetical protein
LFWDASAESLGIGTSSPSSLLEVSGTGYDNATFTSTYQSGGRTTYNLGPSGALLGYIGNAYQLFSGSTSDFAVRAQNGLAFATGGNQERMRIDSSGRVGIGTSSPSEKLEIAGAASATSTGIAIKNGSATRLRIFHNDNAGTNYISSHDVQAAQTLFIRSGNNLLLSGGGGTEHARISSSGSVGIGTSSPDGILKATSGSSPNASQLLIGYNGTSENYFDANTQIFRNGSFAEKMRIDSSGNLLVGTTDTMLWSNSGSGEGIALMSGSYGGYLVAARDGGTVFEANRLNSDGTLISLRKDGTTVGSIGTDTSRFKVKSHSLALYLENESNKQLVWGNVSGVPYFYPQSDNDTNIGYPTQRFKDLYLSGTANVGYVNGSSSVSIPDNYSYGFGGTGSNTYISGSNAANSIWFRTNGNERARIDSSGNLLVGKTAVGMTNEGIELNTGNYLGITKDSAPCAYLRRNTNDGTIIEFRKDISTVGSIGTTSGHLYISGNGTNSAGLRLQNNGIISPTSNSVISGDTVDIGQAGARFKDLYLSGKVASASNNFYQLNDGSFGTVIQSAGGIKFNTAGGNERARIDSSGNLLVGKTSTALTTAGIALRDSGLGQFTVDGNPVLELNRETSSGTLVDIRQDGTTVGSISVSSSATSYNTSSDQRLKENIADADDAGSKIDAIQVRKFDWKADGSHQDYGMIAQELQAVAPEAVSVPEDSEEMMGVDYSKLVPMLIKEIQSLRNRVASLEE